MNKYNKLMKLYIIYINPLRLKNLKLHLHGLNWLIYACNKDLSKKVNFMDIVQLNNAIRIVLKQ